MFNSNTTIKVNNKSFHIVNVSQHPHHVELQGTLEGDASFLAGKRTIIANNLVKVKNGYTYNWNAK